MRNNATDNQQGGLRRFPAFDYAFGGGNDTTTLPPDPYAGGGEGGSGGGIAIDPDSAASPIGHASHIPGMVGAGGYAPVSLLDYLQGAAGTRLGAGNIYGSVAPTLGGTTGTASADPSLGRGNSDGSQPGNSGYVSGSYTTGMNNVDNYVYGNRASLPSSSPTGQGYPPSATPAPTGGGVTPPATGGQTPPIIAPPAGSGSGGSSLASGRDAYDTEAAQNSAQDKPPRYRGLQDSFGSN